MSAADLARLLQHILMLGTVASVDVASARCTVTSGDLLTAPLPWLTARAGDARTWWAPSVGEQVLVLSPGGDPACGVVMPALYSTAHPAPSNQGDTAHVAVYPDGAVVYYDPQAHALSAVLPEGGTAELTASGGVHITGDTTITGKLHITKDVTADAKMSVADDLTCDATVTASTDCVGGGIHLKTHTHSGVQSGASSSGPPQ